MFCLYCMWSIHSFLCSGSLLDQRTSQSVICPRWECQTRLPGGRHPLSYYQLDHQRDPPLRSVHTPTCTYTYLNTLPHWLQCMCWLWVCAFLTAIDKDPRRTLTASGSLILNDVNFGDTAIYQCRASNKHGTILTNTNVYVIGEPYILLTKQSSVSRLMLSRLSLLKVEYVQH